MTFLNLNYGLLAYEDMSASQNPKFRVWDYSSNTDEVIIDQEKSDRLTLLSNEIKDIAVTSRTLAWDVTTEMKFTRFGQETAAIRLQHTGTGTAPVFRAKRNIGADATTELSITQETSYVSRIQSTGGTPWTPAIEVKAGDFLKFEVSTDEYTSPFHATNQGKEFAVQAVGIDYIDFIDNGASAKDVNIVLGADFDKVIRCLGQSPVRVGDTISVEGFGINPSNTGDYTITNVSEDYIEVNNNLGREETFFNNETVVVYEYLIGFMHLRASGSFQVRFNSQTEWLDINKLGGGSAVAIMSVNCHSIQARNIQTSAVSISVQTSKVAT